MNNLLEKLNKSIEIAQKNNFYKGKIHQIKKLEEILEFPALKKEDLLQLSIYDFIQDSHSDLYEYHESSGSTNIPLTTWFSKNDFMAYVSQLNESPIAFNENDMVLIRFPYALSVPAHTFTELVHKNGGCVIHAGRGDNHCSFSKVVQLLVKTKATIFASNIQEAFILAAIAQASGYDLRKDFNLRAICTAGEVFTNARKNRLEELWGVPVYNFYGTTELGNLAITDKDETLLASTNHFYFEALNPKDLKPVTMGEKGILYVTTLSKNCFPLIRYCTRDVVTITNNENGDLKHLLKIKHYGRDSEVIAYGDKKITFADVQNAMLSLSSDVIGNMWKIKRLKEGFQIIAESDRVNEIDAKKIKLNFDIPHEIKLVEKGTIFDVHRYMNEKIAGKPVYFI